MLVEFLVFIESLWSTEMNILKQVILSYISFLLSILRSYEVFFLFEEAVFGILACCFKYLLGHSTKEFFREVKTLDNK